MSNAKVTIPTDKIDSLIDDNAFAGDKKNKQLHHYFNLYFIAIIVVFTASLLAMSYFVSQQGEQSQAIIDEQLSPLKVKFEQQSYLVKIDLLIGEALQNSEWQRLISLQEQISLQSKKLSLIPSAHQSIYQKWFAKNNIAIDSVTEISSQYEQAELVKNKTLIQIDTLIDAIGIQLKKEKIEPKTVIVLSQLQIQLSKIFTLLAQLNLQTSVEEFAKFKGEVNKIFLDESRKKLAAQKAHHDDMEEMLKDFIYFESLIVKKQLIKKWKNSLTLFEAYQQQLFGERQQLLQLLEDLSQDKRKSNSKQSQRSQLLESEFDGSNKGLTNTQQWIWIICFCAFASFGLLLWLVRLRIKVATSYGLAYLTHALDNETSPFIFENGNGLSAQQVKAFYCQEAYLLLQKIHLINNSRLSHAESNSLMIKSNEQQSKILDLESELSLLGEQLAAGELSLKEALDKQAHIENISDKESLSRLHQQLQELGATALSSKIKGSHTNNDSANEYLVSAHAEGITLINKLEENISHRYLQSTDAVLTLGDVNFLSLIQATLLNLNELFSAHENMLMMDVDDQISATVNVDIALFSTLFNTFIQLIVADQRNIEVSLGIQLVDKNQGRQKISFTGKVVSTVNKVKMPIQIQSLISSDDEQHELSQFFSHVLKCQYAESVSAELIDEGYQFSFALPLTAINVKGSNSAGTHSNLILPVKIDKTSANFNLNYAKMPIEVLMAVNSPIIHQQLKQSIHAIGLKVTMVTCDLLFSKLWNSGRFAILLADMDIDPATHFDTEKAALISRGVFSLDSAIDFTDKKISSEHWILGELAPKSSVEEMSTLLSPWLNNQNSTTTQIETPMNKIEEKPSGPAFDFDSYIKHQGSLEIALYMLDDYVDENVELVENLKRAFTGNDAGAALISVEGLSTNSKILAAEQLVSLCLEWQLIIKDQYFDNQDNKQINLLNATVAEVQEIKLYSSEVA